MHPPGPGEWTLCREAPGTMDVKLSVQMGSRAPHRDLYILCGWGETDKRSQYPQRNMEVALRTDGLTRRRFKLGH